MKLQEINARIHLLIFLELWRQKVPDVAENPSDRDQWIEWLSDL